MLLVDDKLVGLGQSVEGALAHLSESSITWDDKSLVSVYRGADSKVGSPVNRYQRLVIPSDGGLAEVRQRSLDRLSQSHKLVIHEQHIVCLLYTSDAADDL